MTRFRRLAGLCAVALGLATTFLYTGAPAGVVEHTATALYDSTTAAGGYSDVYTAGLRR
jgi:hypothetical protein